MKNTNLYFLTTVISLFCFTIRGMEQQRGAKRVLFPSEASPSKGYGTDLDMGSPGTPASYKKTKASLGIHKIYFINTTYLPVVLTYQGSSGTSVTQLAPFNHPNKNLNAFKNEIVLSKPLYISTQRGLFRIMLNSEKNRIIVAHPTLYSAEEPEGFIERSSIDYQPEKQLTIRISEDIQSGISYPKVQLAY
jgi:hypothetical protein